jgi:Mor family transcriptional regulator
MLLRKNGKRNREMFAAFEDGATIDQLAEDYRLLPNSVAAILNTERHRRAVSPEPEYRSLRRSAAP